MEKLNVAFNFKPGDHLRQGDVLMIKVDKLPKGAKKVKEGKIIAAYGEKTGHSHTIDSMNCSEFLSGDTRFVQVNEKTEMIHPEHGPIPLDQGVWEIRRQRENTPQGIRMVAD